LRLFLNSSDSQPFGICVPSSQTSVKYNTLRTPSSCSRTSGWYLGGNG
jgi:hypothetical protein